MSILNRFVNNTLKEFIPLRTFSQQQTIARLELEIYALHEWLLNNEPGSETWKEKRTALLRKIENLNEVKEEN